MNLSPLIEWGFHMNLKEALLLVGREQGTIPSQWTSLPWEDAEFSETFLENEELGEDVTLEESTFLSQVLRGPLVLDAGCGGGRSLQGFNSSNVCDASMNNDLHTDDWNLFGIDIGFSALVKATGRLPLASFVQGDILHFPFRNESFNSIISLFGSWLSFPVGDFEQFLRECSRLLKADGILVLEAPSLESLLELDGLREWSVRDTSIGGAFQQLVLSENFVVQSADCGGSIPFQNVYIRKDHIVDLSSGNLKTYCQFYSLYAVRELTQLLDKTGFSSISTYGDFDGSVPDDDSRRIIITATK